MIESSRNPPRNNYFLGFRGTYNRAVLRACITGIAFGITEASEIWLISG